MFLWDKSVTALNLPADRVVHLFRSMRPVQLALPGIPVQQASAFLCQLKGSEGIVTTAVFHLEKQHQLAFYFSAPREVSAEKADGMLDQGMNFVESMGFLLADLDIHLLNGSDRDLLWDSLPLKDGAKPDEPETSAPPAPPAKSAEPPAREPDPPVSAPRPSRPPATASAGAADNAVAVAAPSHRAKAVPSQDKPSDAAPAAVAEGVDDLLAAVSALRANRPGLRARKTPPPPEELNRRRKELRENLGRILASL